MKFVNESEIASRNNFKQNIVLLLEIGSPLYFMLNQLINLC